MTLGRDPARNMIACDLASFASVRAAAREIVTRWPRVHLLINNAGVQHVSRLVSVDGIERTLAVNHLAPVLLTHWLLPALRAAGRGGRVLTVSSSLARWGRIHFDDVQLARGYEGTRAYLQSKLANIMFTLSLTERLRAAASSVTAACVYPGLVATDLLRERWWWRSRWLQPAWRTIFLAPNDAARIVMEAAKANECGCFTRGGRLVTPPPAATDPEARRRLWDMSMALVGDYLPS